MLEESQVGVETAEQLARLRRMCEYLSSRH